MKAFILAGGQGIRLRPLTYKTPKPLLTLNDKTLLELNIDLLKGAGVTEIIVSVGYMADKIKDYFGDGSRFGVKISYVEENPDKPLGTGGPVRLAKYKLDETFVFLNADELKEIDIKKMYDFHKKCGGIGTIALYEVEDPSPYGVVQMDGDKIVEFVEKPKKEEAPSKWVNAGLSILEPEAIEFIPKKDNLVSMEREAFPEIAKAGKLFGFKFDGYWNDVGTLEKYQKLAEEIKTGKLRINDGKFKRGA